MKHVYFMLFLSIFQITSLTAQVRIGGLTEPNKATVLDLNASDATTDGTRGLALPRVSLADTVALLNGATPPNGTMVYNTNANLGEGIYVWSSNKWSPAITPLRADSGQYLKYNGKDWVPATFGIVYRGITLEAGAPFMDLSADSTGFGTTKVFIQDCPCVLDMVPLHTFTSGVGAAAPDDLTMWSVYFENHQDSIYQFPSYPPGTYVEKHYDVYTMGFMIMTLDKTTDVKGKPQWGGVMSYPHGSGLITLMFRCLKY